MTRMGTLWNPWREMNRLRRDMDHLMNFEWAPTGSRDGARFRR